MQIERQKRAAKAFVERWIFRRGSEKGEDQQFWNGLLGDVLGMDDLATRVQYQAPVPMKGTTKFLDAWIPETRVLVEHKSRGVDLDAPQSGHGGLTPYEQAVEYDNARPFDEKARWIVVCNFDTFRIYDRTKPLAQPLVLRLRDLPKEVYRLAFLVNPKERAVDRELEISVRAGRIVGELYEALLRQYHAVDSAALAALNRLCVRIVFCLYAEDAGVFPKDCLRRLVEATPVEFLRSRLAALFRTLDTPCDRRDPYLEPELAAFPYTNGGLFHDATEGEIPPMSEEIRRFLLGASQFDWRGITPTIFGALFESTLNPETRRAGGMVYTSVENIHRVIDPLFLDALTRRVNAAVGADSFTPKAVRNLAALQDELASLTFLDPACGSGNFLTETYVSLRRLENRLIAARQRGQGELDLGQSVKVSLAQFHGIELNDFAVAVAKTALWIAEAQMLRETAEILHREPEFLPLRDAGGIVEGNALRLDWPSADYVIGNPPFVGRQFRSKEQVADMDSVYADWKDVNYGVLDYVAAWYKRASATSARCAFVSTNSICQGELVAPMWKPLIERAGVVIDFAWRTFLWNNESIEKAHVHCVIVGFHAERNGGTKRSANLGCDDKTIHDRDGVVKASNICPYLIDAPTVFVESRRKAISDCPPLVFGSMPNDGGYLSDWSDAAREAVLEKWPEAASLFRRIVGSREVINGLSRWCLWLKTASPSLVRSVPPVVEAIEKCRAARLSSARAATRRLAESPQLFGEIRQPEDGSYLLIPSVSSERRRYIPIAFFGTDAIANNLALIVPHATLYHFGVLISSVHMAWMRVVAGRLEMRYRYSAAIVYNNFPWPETAHTGEISATAQAILDVRARYPEATLADLYDPLTMPADLRKAHAANDHAVLAAYGLKSGTSESEIVAHLFRLYAEKTSPAHPAP